MRHIGEVDIGRTVRGKRVVMMRLDPDRGEGLEGKRVGKIQILPWGGGKERGKDVEGLTRSVDSG